jgi:integrase
LKSAEIEKWTDEGKVDFHSLRVSCVSWILEAGASAKEAQELARHSTPSLTLNTDGRAGRIGWQRSPKASAGHFVW